MNRELFEVFPEDYDKLKSYYKLRRPVTCENIITDCYIWKNYYNTRYYINEYGLVWIYENKDEIFTTMPLCTYEDLPKCFEDMRLYFNNVLGRKLKVYLAEEDSVECLNLPSDKYLVEEERDYFDYVYDADKLRRLPGKHYHKKKNHINSFLKEYGDRYKIIMPCCAAKDEIMEFLKRWHGERDIEDEYNRDDYELEGIEYILSHCGMIHYYMMCIYVDDVMEAFTIGTYIKEEKTAYIHVEKANPNIRGLYPFVNQQFLVNCFPDAEYVNREDDMGLEGLRKAKMSYNPIKLVKKYTITEL